MIKPEVKILKQEDLNLASLAARVTRVGFKALDEEINNDLAIKVSQKLKHESILEHIHFTFLVKNVSRALVNLIEMNRLCSFSERSFRRLQSDLNFTVFADLNQEQKDEYIKEYEDMLLFHRPEDARSVLPLSVVTDLMISCNGRSLIYMISKLRNFYYENEQQKRLFLEAQAFCDVLQNEISFPWDHIYIDDRVWRPWTDHIYMRDMYIYDDYPMIDHYRSDELKSFIIVDVLSESALSQLRRHRIGTLIEEARSDPYSRRMGDPVRFLWSVNFREFAKILELRGNPSAQKEIRDFILSVKERLP